MISISSASPTPGPCNSWKVSSCFRISGPLGTEFLPHVMLISSLPANTPIYLVSVYHPLRSRLTCYFLRETYAHTPKFKLGATCIHSHTHVCVVFPLECEHHEGRNWAYSVHHYLSDNCLSVWQKCKPHEYLLQNEFSLHRKDLEVGRDTLLVFRADWAYKVFKCQQRS